MIQYMPKADHPPRPPCHRLAHRVSLHHRSPFSQSRGMTGSVAARRDAMGPGTPELASTGTPVHTQDVQHATPPPPRSRPVITRQGQPGRRAAARLAGPGKCRCQTRRSTPPDWPRGRAWRFTARGTPSAALKMGRLVAPAACGRMTAARARRARALGRRLKKGNVGMRDAGWRLGCQGGGTKQGGHVGWAGSAGRIGRLANGLLGLLQRQEAVPAAILGRDLEWSIPFARLMIGDRASLSGCG